MVLVSQPTHPAFYDRDVRHHKCNVCLEVFNVDPPTRHDLMESFTGPELASLIEVGCIIAADEVVSAEMERELEGMPPSARSASGYHNWIRGVYLITDAKGEDGVIHLPVGESEQLDSLRNRLGDELRMQFRGQQYHLAPLGDLEGVAEDQLGPAFAALTTPCSLALAPVEPPSCGDDLIVAVNLTRPLARPRQSDLVTEAVAAVTSRYSGATQVRLEHYAGGPCDMANIQCCVVPGGSGRGWTSVKELEAAVQLAHSRAAKRSGAQGDLGGGQAVRIDGLQAQPYLNGEIGMTLQFLEGSGRWLVRLRNGEGKQLRPANLVPMEPGGGRVLVFWGDAQWSRTQLLGEIARGHWGLCRASVSEVHAKAEERFFGMGGRLAFAPVTEMTEAFLRDGQREMQALRASREAAGGEPQENLNDME